MAICGVTYKVHLGLKSHFREDGMGKWIYCVPLNKGSLKPFLGEKKRTFFKTFPVMLCYAEPRNSLKRVRSS